MALAAAARDADVLVTTGAAWRGDTRTLATLLCEGYTAKAAALGVDRDTAIAVLADALRPDRCLVATRAGQAVGVVGLVEGRAHALDFRFAVIRRRVGVVRATAFALLMSVRNWTLPVADELVFEALAVSPGERNQGIGTRLVEHVEAYARQKGYRSVGLEVTDSNATAIGLYARRGYSIVKTRHYGVLTRRAGFTGNHQMRKRLPNDPCPSL